MKALLVVCMLGGVAIAGGPKGGSKVDPKQVQADALFEKGQTSYQSGQYQEAIELFKQAYTLVEDPVYLFNIAQSYRKVADCLHAHDYYTQYLDEAPKAENKDKVQQWLTELQPCVDQRHAEQDAVKQAQDAEKKRQEDEARRRAEAMKPVPMEVDHGKPLRIAGIATGAIGVGGLVVGIVYGIKSKNLKNQVADMCTKGCQWDDPDTLALDSQGKTDNSRAKLGYIAGGIMTLAGAGLYVFGRTRVETVMVTPNAAGGATASVSLSF